MYSKQEASLIRKKFWTSLGQYMKPLLNSEGERVNWLNYKTNIKHIYFRMDAGKFQASIAIELTHPDAEMQWQYFEQFIALKNILEETVGEPWQWQPDIADENGNIISRIGIELKNVNIFNTNDWPAIISFFKPRIMALDSFWNMVKFGFE